MDFTSVESDIGKFFADGNTVTYTAGQQFKDFESQPDLMMITKGYIKLVTYKSNAQERIQYIAGPGEGVPMHNLFSQMPPVGYPLFAVAFTDVSFLVKQRADFLRYIEANPTIVIAILQGIMQAAFDRLYNFNLETSAEKVAHMLVLYAKKFGSVDSTGYVKLDPAMTTYVIASSVDLSKDTTAQILHGFESTGHVAYQDGALLVSVDKLKTLASLR